MKLSNLIANILLENDIPLVFAISGGASLHLIHSIAETEGIDFVCPQHEQGAAMAADGYARVSGGIGCAVATSGPGATNLVTGIASSFYDSVPVLFLTGQVATFRAKGDTGVRQIGFQETEIVEICRTITKYAVLIKDPYSIRYEIEKALIIARSGRPGPVLVDIPDDFQRMEIDPQKVKSYVQTEKYFSAENPVSEVSLFKCIDALKNSNRPVIILGWGVHLSGAEELAIKLARITGIPIALTWGARDLVPEEDPLLIGGFGTHGTRYANFAVQNSDFILSIGARLDTKATGSPASTFARDAKIVMVDIDIHEIEKFNYLNKKIDIGIQADATDFLQFLLCKLDKQIFTDRGEWIKQIMFWKRQYPISQSIRENDGSIIDPYEFVKLLSENLHEDQIIFSDTGCALAWMMQSFEFKKGQRFFHAFNNTPMGYGLAGAIGGAFAVPGKQIILISGDGSVQMSIQELATVVRHSLPIKIILFNNHGHGMVRQTQEMWLEGNYYATSVNGGLPDPDFVAIAKAYGLAADSISNLDEAQNKISKLMAADGPFLLTVEIDKESKVMPQVKYGRPNEDAEPLLSRSEFLSNMLIEPLSEFVKE